MRKYGILLCAALLFAGCSEDGSKSDKGTVDEPGTGGTTGGGTGEGSGTGGTTGGEETKDECPDDANKTEAGLCGCGVVDTDSDGDTVPDCNDGCTDDALKTEAGVCGCGVADTDSDGDTVPDCNDACPDDANKTEAGVCGCGQLDSSEDSDGDGVLDCYDACPNDPKKSDDAGVCGCGTDEFDQDGDTVPDCVDVCPLHPTNYDAYAGDELIASVDAKAAALREEILNTKDELDFGSFAHVYYISNDGDDSNDGLSPETAFKTIAQAHTVTAANDAVRFRRGDIFRGAWTAQSGVTYAAYGEGRKPRIYGSTENGAGADNWTLVDEAHHIWKYKHSFSPDVGGIIFNEGEAHGLKEIPSWDIANQKFVLRLDHAREFNMAEQLDNDLEFFWDGHDKITGDKVPNVNTSTGDLYLRSDTGNPGTRFTSIEFNPRYNAISISSNDNITFDNLAIMYTGSHGIGGGDHPDNLTVTNCEIGWIGGGIQYYNTETGNVVRYGNGVEIYGGCDGYKVQHNWVYECYDAGLTHQRSQVGDKEFVMENIEYSNNLLEYNVYNIEYFISGVNEGNNSVMRNVKIDNNIMRFAGYGWGHQRPDKGSAAHIKSWTSSNPGSNFNVTNNLFDRSRYYSFHVYTDPRFGEESVPKFSNNVYIQDLGASFGILGNVSTQTSYTCNNVLENVANSIDDKGIYYFATEARLDEKTDCPTDVRAANPDNCICDMTNDNDNDGTVNCQDFCPTMPTDYEVIASAADFKAVEDIIEARRAEIINSADSLTLPETVLYISPNGADSNDGKTPETALKSFTTAQNKCGGPCAILFERGGVYRGEWTPGSHRFIGAYGTGAKPILTRGEEVSDPALWEEVDATRHIWKLKNEVSDVGTIVFNGSTSGVKIAPKWDLNKKAFVNAEGSVINAPYFGDRDFKQDLSFMVLAASTLSDSGLPSISKSKGDLYIRSDRGNPAEAFDSVWITNVGRVFHLSSGQSDITFDNIAFKYSGSNAVGGNGKPISDITISNCEIAWNGGALGSYNSTTGQPSRSGDAVYMNDDLKNITFKDNYVHDNYANGLNLYYANAGVTGKSLTNIKVTNNLFERNFTGMTYYISGVDAQGTSMISNLDISDNIFTRSGEGWSYAQRTDGSNSGHLRSGNASNPGENITINNNTFYRSKYISLYIYKSSSKGSLPTFSGNSYYQKYNSYFGFVSDYSTTNFIYDCSLLNRFVGSANKMEDSSVRVKYILE